MRALTILGVLLVASSVSADGIDDAIVQLEEGEFEAARALLESSRPTTRIDLVRLYEARARLAHALREDTTLSRDLRALASLDPGHAFPPSAPPDLAERLSAVGGGALEVDVVVRDVGTGLSLTLRTSDPGSLVSGTRLHVRVDGEWQAVEESSIAVPVEAGQRVEYWAEAIGPNGIVVASLGSEATPESHARVGGPEEVAREQVTSDDPITGPAEDPNARRRRILLAVGITAAMLLVAAAVAFAVVYPGLVQDTQLETPMIR